MAKPESTGSSSAQGVQASNDPQAPEAGALAPEAGAMDQDLAGRDDEAAFEAEPDLGTASDAELDVALDDGDLMDDDADTVDLDQLAGQCTGREQSIRRALEERREARRLRDDLDYLDFDD